ncbi:hypothetical protein A3I53_01815 [Candidatus Curtissbacteria bacterium RIFCSPLOWO2_02_FULL_40_13b]|uniref:ComEC/Rec2-related protein domain-containing protein n=1 Tax=Candidatus Curtissbacteria bacterium RIFCSPLOWO2_02_FULL_40_13b TaxID=1797733 RepID=A0A1F5HPJ6_9BACT|nr:MAG: hypothetical protein A3I53_01815 [Candidatus Curtissbacteria bacterium RIFCSPLOWO2_02_FULL_40_13b]
MAKFLNILAVTVLICAVAIRSAWFLKDQKQTILPKNTQIKFAFKVKREPKISYQNQIIEVGEDKIITGLYPKYRVGEKLIVEGVADDVGRIYYPKIEVTGQDKGFTFYLWLLRQKISGNFQKLLPAGEATLVGGTVLGIDSISQSFRDQLIKTGTIHVVVVSGQNLMIVAGIFLSFAQFLGRRKSLILATAAVFFYAFLTGLEPPVLRASIMVLASTLAIYFGREVWPIWNLALAVLIIAFIWPNAILEVSFQLTFAASLGIMTLGQYLLKTWQKLPFLGQNAAIAVSAYLFTAPVILFHFGKIWPLAPLANILVMEAVFPLMILGFLTAFTSLIFMPLAVIFAYLAFAPAFFFVKTVEIFSKIPIDQISLGKGSLLMAVGWYGVMLFLMWIWRRK